MKLFKKGMAVICVISIVLCILFASTNVVHAYSYVAKVSAMNKATGDTTVVNPFKNIGQAVLTVLRVVAVGVAVLMLIVLAIKYMSAAPSERATIKKSAVMYVAGAIIMFAAAGILGIIKNFAGNI